MRLVQLQSFFSGSGSVLLGIVNAVMSGSASNHADPGIGTSTGYSGNLREIALVSTLPFVPS